MNNTVFRKEMEKVRKSKSIKLVKTKERSNYIVSEQKSSPRLLIFGFFCNAP